MILPTEQRLKERKSLERGDQRILQHGRYRSCVQRKNPFEINETVSKVYAWKHLTGSKLGKHRDHGDIGELLRYQIVPKNNFMGQNFSLLDDA